MAGMGLCVILSPPAAREEGHGVQDRPVVAFLAITVALLLLGSTVAGIAIGRAFIGTPIGLALGVGTGVLLSTAAVTRVMLGRFEALASTDQREESPE